VEPLHAMLTSVQLPGHDTTDSDDDARSGAEPPTRTTSARVGGSDGSPMSGPEPPTRTTSAVVAPAADVGAAPSPAAAEPLEEEAIRKTFAPGGMLRDSIVRMACCEAHPAKPRPPDGRCASGPPKRVDAFVAPRDVEAVCERITCSDGCLCGTCIDAWKPIAYRIMGGQSPARDTVVAAREAALWAVRKGRGLLCVLANGDCGPNSLRACIALDACAPVQIPSVAELREGATGKHGAEPASRTGWWDKTNIAAAAERAGVEAPLVVHVDGKDERVVEDVYTVDAEEAAWTGCKAGTQLHGYNPDFRDGAAVAGDAHAEGRPGLEDLGG